MYISVSDLGQNAQKQVLSKYLREKQKAESKDENPQEKRRGKYNNQKTAVISPTGEPIVFDSSKEAERYKELLALKSAGKIRNLKLQPEFTLVEAYKDANTGERQNPMKYRADFSYEVYMEPTGPLFDDGEWRWAPVVEDVKGVETKEFKIKEKLMRERGIAIKKT